MTSPPTSSITCPTCRGLVAALGPPLENVYTAIEWIWPATQWAEVPSHYLVGGPKKRAICRACGRRAWVSDYGGNRGKLELSVKDAPENAPDVVPPLTDCTRCAGLLAQGWPRIVEGEYELMGGDVDETHGPLAYTTGEPGRHPYPPCRECGRVVSVITEYRSSGWYTRVPLRRP